MDLAAIAKQFNVDPGALQCLVQFLGDNIAKDPAAFVNATPAHRDAIIKEGVQAWHVHSRRMLNELAQNRTEWAQAARDNIATDVYNTIRAQQAGIAQ